MSTITGGSGNDSQAGTTGWDTIYGGAGNDTAAGYGGDDQIFGGTGADLIYAGDGNDIGLGGAGNDTSYGDVGNDSLLGGGDADVIYGGAGMDALLGEAGNDTLDGGTKNDWMDGGVGSDSLLGGAGNDTLNGDGSNINPGYFPSTGAMDTQLTIVNTATFAIDVYWINTSGVGVYYGTIAPGGSMTQPTGSTHNWYITEQGQTAVLDLIQGAVGQTYTLTSDFNDTLDGGIGDDQINGGYGADSILAGDGNDTVTGGVGNDTVFGGQGSDNITLGDGNDSFGDWSTEGGNDTVYGGLGNDYIIGGGENDLVDGGDGNDSLSGGVGSDSAYGGAGSDVFMVTDDHEYDYLDGGETGTDFDVVYLGNYLTTQGVTVTFSGTGAGNYDFDGSAGYGSFVGIEGMAGTDYADILNAGADTGGILLEGNAGADSMTGGSGNDTLYGGVGADTIYFGAGADTVYGGDGDDLIDDVNGTNQAGASLVYGGTGNDQIWAGGGNDTVYGDDGNDVVDAELGNDSVFGGAGNDTLWGGDGNDTLSGGSGDDGLYGGADSDLIVVNPNEGTDLVYGGETGTDRDTLQLNGTANQANTVIFTGNEAGTYSYTGGGSGSFNQIEVIETGAGNDLVDATASSAGVEVYGGTGQDTLKGGSGADILMAGDGNDQLKGGAGNDLLSGGGDTDQIFIGLNDGIDTIQGGETGSDYDFLTFSTSVAGPGVKVTFTAAETGTYSYTGGGSGSFTGIEEVDGSAGADTIDASLASTGVTIKGGAGNDSILGGASKDFLQGDDGNDTIFGGGGNDTLNGDAGNDLSYGGEGDDWLLSGEGNNQSYGGDGNDYLFDASGASLLDGGAGNDTIYGSGGNDTLIGGAGNDTMTGADDQDRFVITDGFGVDTIVGGEGGADFDTIDMSAVTGATTTTFGATGAGSITEGGNSISFSQVEKLVLGAGADVVYAGADTAGIEIATGAGNDTVYGGTGADTLSGGDGADLLVGGGGNDVIASGAGSDRIALLGGGGSDVIQDFDMSLLAGITADQLDVSDLRTLDGKPLHARDVVISADTAGNAVLTFPQGEKVTLIGVAPAAVTGKQALASIGVPCFASGTRIATPMGERRVEDLRAGDLVQTLDEGAQPILWAGARQFDADDLAARPDMRPVLIRDGALGNRGDVLVSPQHAVLVATDQGARLARARHLAALKDGRFRVARGRREVCYHHLLLPRHAVIFANGAACESLYPGPQALRSFGPALCADLLRVLPPLQLVIAGSKATSAVYGPLARPILGQNAVARLGRVSAAAPGPLLCHSASPQTA